MSGLFSKASTKMISEKAPKCPLIGEREKFPRWIQQFERYVYGLGVDEYVFKDQPKPPDGTTKTAKTDLKNWQEKRREAFLIITLAAGDDHEDIFQNADKNPFIIMNNLKKKFGFSDAGDGTSAHYLLSAFMSAKLSTEGDLPANLTNYITELNTLADNANALAKTTVISDELKFSQLSMNCGPLTQFIQSTILNMKDKKFGTLVEKLNDLMRMPKAQLDVIMGLSREPNQKGGSFTPNQAENPPNHTVNAVMRPKKQWNPKGQWKSKPYYGKNNFNNYKPKFKRPYYQPNHKPWNKKFPNQRNKHFHNGGVCRFCGGEGHDPNHCPRIPSYDDMHPNKTARVCTRVALNVVEEEDYILLDCGATDSHLREKKYFKKLEENLENVEKIASACGSITQTRGVGMIGNIKFYYTPAFTHNLLSLSQLLDIGYTADVSKECITIRFNEAFEVKAMKMNGLFKIKMNTFLKEARKINEKENKKAFLGKLGEINFEQFHKITHLGDKTYQRLHQLRSVKGIKPGKVVETKCSHCLRAKLRRKSYKKRRIITSDLLPLTSIYTDLKGPLSPQSFNGFNYVASFIDEATRYKWIYPISHKDDVAEAFEHFVQENISPLLRNTTNSNKLQFKSVKSDGGGEYEGRFTLKCKEYGFKQIIVPRSTPELNGIAENYWRTLFSTVRAFMFSAPQIPNNHWPEAVIYANDVLNCTLLVPVDGTLKTPHERLFGEVPDLRKFHVFGEKVYVFIPKELRDNTSLQEHATEAYFVGFDRKHINSGRFLQKLNPGYKIIIQDYDNVEYVGTDLDEPLEEQDELSIDDFQTMNNEHSPISTESNSEQTKSEKKRKRSQKVYQKVRKSIRLIEKEQAKIAHAAVLEEKSLSLKDIMNLQNSKERILSLDALLVEIKSIEARKVWIVESITHNKTLLKTKWIFTTKFDHTGREIRKKARLVVIGCLAVEGIDYTETYAPVTKLPSLRVFLSLVCQFNLYMFQLDVDTAFLYADLEEEIYLEIPPMFTYYHKSVDIRNKCLRLQKALYGLPQAPRAWFRTIDKFFKESGYKPLIHEPCIYIKVCRNQSIALMTLYVDDMIIAHNNYEELMRLVTEIERKFQIKKIGVPKKMLGISIKYKKDEGLLAISTKDKIIELTKEYQINEKLAVPLPAGTKFKKEEKSDMTEEDKTKYRSLLGKLMFIMVATRPDIAFAVSLLARYMNNPMNIHYQSAINILKYLYGTVNWTVVFKRKSFETYNLVAYSDSDWGGDLLNRRSRSGGVIFLGGSPIYWSSNIQTLVALSSAEAEINALKEIVKSVLWIRGILKDIQILPGISSKPTLVYEDNSSVLEIVINPEVSKRNRHYDMSYHFIRENIEEFKNILIRWIDTDNNVADLFTKALDEKKLSYFRERILVNKD